MKILNEKPPIYDKACKAFEVTERTVFCYGDTIYNPSGIELSRDLIAHEEVHSKQQGDDPDDWWDKYIADPEFRLDQEVEAYQVQYRYLFSTERDKGKRHASLIHMANTLSGPLYGRLMTWVDAMRIIPKLTI